MTYKFKRGMAAVLSVIVMGTYAEAAEITVSESRIELDKAQTEFSFELDIEEDELFAGAEFGITLPEGMTLSSVEYLDDEIKNAAHTPVVVKNGRAYFGFYSSENVFSGAYNAARLTFEYEGDADAVAWAEANGIVKGYSETEFGPDDNITREQIAAIMHRYAGFKGVDGDTAGDLGAFSDADKISGWAEEDMRWAVGTGLINGRGESIDPLGLATRAETAAVLQRFIEGTE